MDIAIRSYDKKIHNIQLTGEVNEGMFTKLAEAFDNILKSDDEIDINNQQAMNNLQIEYVQKHPDINIYLSSFGGNVYDMLSIYDMIRRIQHSYVVNLYCYGKVMSAATIIMLAVDKEHRFAALNTTFMIHTLSSLNFGKIKELEENVEETKRLHNIIWSIYKDNTTIPDDKLNDVYEKKQDWFFDSFDAKLNGLITDIV